MGGTLRGEVMIRKIRDTQAFWKTLWGLITFIPVGLTTIEELITLGQISILISERLNVYPSNHDGKS
jgi:hypothetical protein